MRGFAHRAFSILSRRCFTPFAAGRSGLSTGSEAVFLGICILHTACYISCCSGWQAQAGEVKSRCQHRKTAFKLGIIHIPLILSPCPRTTSSPHSSVFEKSAERVEVVLSMHTLVCAFWALFRSKPSQKKPDTLIPISHFCTLRREQPNDQMSESLFNTGRIDSNYG